jgi:hypothetical protein
MPRRYTTGELLAGAIVKTYRKPKTVTDPTGGLATRVLFPDKSSLRFYERVSDDQALTEAARVLAARSGA